MALQSGCKVQDIVRSGFNTESREGVEMYRRLLPYEHCICTSRSGNQHQLDVVMCVAMDVMSPNSVK